MCERTSLHSNKPTMTNYKAEAENTDNTVPMRLRAVAVYLSEKSHSKITRREAESSLSALEISDDIAIIVHTALDELYAVFNKVLVDDIHSLLYVKAALIESGVSFISDKS